MKKHSGKGTFKYIDGDVYDGEIQDAEPHGIGKMTHKDGRVAEGIWRKGKIVYEGELANGSRREEANGYTRTGLILICMRENGKMA